MDVGDIQVDEGKNRKAGGVNGANCSTCGAVLVALSVPGFVPEGR
jgi:hypothetical protein